MNEIAIRVSELGKRYRLKHQTGAYRTFREELVSLPRRLWSSLATTGDLASDEFWALQNISFELSRGEVLGVIGRNGAGKSTLLKILSRIVEPTCGEAEIYGRVGSLLEVGTGFHPELTGRENIYLSGAILGMKRREIRGRFDEIVSFAEVERFVDTPCKYYSSGMYTRLAFSVAAHLDPEILIVDEVLAVGDASFQQRCLGKVRSLSRDNGRTVLFVSHNIAAVRSLCSRGLYLKAGRLIEEGTIDRIVGLYGAEQEIKKTEYQRGAPVKNQCGIVYIRVKGPLSPDLDGFLFGAPIEIEIGVHALSETRILQVALRLSNDEGTPILTTTSFDAGRKPNGLPAGLHHFRVILPSFLSSGGYEILVALCDPQKEVFDVVEGEVRFSINGMGSLATDLADNRRGSIEVVLPWAYSVLK